MLKLAGRSFALLLSIAVNLSAYAQPDGDADLSAFCDPEGCSSRWQEKSTGGRCATANRGDRRDCGGLDWLELSGWMSGGMTLNADGNRSGNGNAPYGYNNVSDGAVLNQLWLHVGKEIEADAGGVDWGFGIDYLFGTDGPDNQAFADESWDFGWNSSRDYGSAIPQLYADLQVDHLMVRVGYFLTPIGWEYVQAPLNFFYSHSYTFYYSEPNTHSGLLATYTCNDRLTIQAGWTLGIDSSFANYLNASTFVGGARFSFGDDTSINWTLVAGDWGDGTGRRDAPSNDGDVYIHSVIFEHNYSERCSYVFHHDFGVNSGISGPDTHWYAIVQYVTFEITEAWQMGMRLEWFRDDAGVRLGDDFDAGDYYEVTMGLRGNCGDNLVVRPEVRWDWSGGAGLPFDSGSEDDFFTCALSAIVTF